MAESPGRRTPEQWSIRADEAALAVVAHGLLGNVSVIKGAAETLRHPNLDHDTRVRLQEMIEQQAEHITGILRDLILGLPSEVILGLREVEEVSHRRSEDRSA